MVRTLSRPASHAENSLSAEILVWASANAAQLGYWSELPSYALMQLSGELCGFGQYYLGAGRCHLARLAVAPSHRGRGFGTSLIEKSNAPAIALYERLGFYTCTASGDDLRIFHQPLHGEIIRRLEVRPPSDASK